MWKLAKSERPAHRTSEGIFSFWRMDSSRPDARESLLAEVVPGTFPGPDGIRPIQYSRVLTTPDGVRIASPIACSEFERRKEAMLECARARIIRARRERPLLPWLVEGIHAPQPRAPRPRRRRRRPSIRGDDSEPELAGPEVLRGVPASGREDAGRGKVPRTTGQTRQGESR
jgi:hypothetical protein